MIALPNAFGLSGEPFTGELPPDKLFPIPGLSAFIERFDYAIRLASVTVITGEVGSGKSTSLRAATARLHPSQYTVLTIVATTGGSLELLRQLAIALGIEPSSNSQAKLLHTIRETLSALVAKKQTPVLLIDEAHLMRLELFASLHTLTQLPYDQHPLLPMVLSGQSTLLDRLMYHTSRPFASRVMGRTHLAGLARKEMANYITHHLTLVDGSAELFADEALTAVHQSSGGLLRRANALSRGAMLAAAAENAPLVTAEHVRLATTEIF